MDEAATVIVLLVGAVARRPDLALVDALARLQLELGRLGGTMYVHSSDPQLSELIELVGLSDVLRAGG